MRGNDRKRWRAAIVSTFIAGFSLALHDQVRGQYLTVYGGPTYDSSTGDGYKAGNPSVQSFLSVPFNVPAVGDGVVVGPLSKYVSGSYQGNRPIRWDSSGNVFELPGLPDGFVDCTVWADNASGVAVGASEQLGVSGSLPVRWSASGAITQLSDGGTGDSAAFAVNSTGLAVGYAGPNAARWNASGTAVTILNNLSSPYTTDASAYAVNDAGTAVGQCALGSPLGSRAVRWNASGSAVTELGNIGVDEHGFTNAAAYAINSAGTAVGWADDRAPFASPRGPRAVRWDASGTTATELDSLGGDAVYQGSIAYAINNPGVAVGMDFDRAVRWAVTGTAETVLPSTSIDPFGHAAPAAAYAVNDSGIAVGYNKIWDPVLDGFFGGTAVMWMPDGSAVDLNSLIDPASGWTLESASAINNNDWVTGIGSFDPDGPGGLAAYNREFLIQVPEPTSMAILLIGVLPMILRRRNASLNAG